MKIRTATLGDCAAIASVHVASEQAAYRGILPELVLQSKSVENQEKKWRKRIESSASPLDVRCRRGWLRLWLVYFGRSRDSDATRSTAEIRAMYVISEKWRRGVGGALWDKTKSALEQAGYSEITLWVLEPNQPARQFYEKVGFVLETDIHKTLEYPPMRIRAVRYRLALS